MAKRLSPTMKRIIECLRSPEIDWKDIVAKSNARVINRTVADVSRLHPKVDPEKVRARVERLIAEVRRSTAEMWRLSTKENERARKDVLLFIYLCEYGWGETVRSAGGGVVAINSPLSKARSLGCPTRWRLIEASRRVRQACPEEVARYKETLKVWREALERFRATESEERWKWYACGKGNTRSLAYRSQVARRRRRGVAEYRKRHRYLYSELLPRKEERKRARREMRAAEKTLSEMQERMFEAMGVPKPLRKLA